MIKKGRFPARHLVAGFTFFFPELLPVGITMAIGAIAAIVLQPFIATRFVALITCCIPVFSFESVSHIGGGIMIEKGLLPACRTVAFIAALLPELPFMWVTVTVRCGTGLVGQPPVSSVFMAFFATKLLMLSIQPVASILW